MPNEFDFLSPGIKIREIDESVIPAETADSGPIIIGRTRKGPAMEPVRVKSLDAFIKTFGKPVAGPGGANTDAWRAGPNFQAPTYASYAAQAWLASGNGPCTIVRVLGDQSSNTVTGDGVAGWQLNTAIPSTVVADNSTAYGLFMIDSASVGGLRAADSGSLAAVFYVDSGHLALKGKPAIQVGGAADVVSASHFIQSNAASLGFTMDVYNSSNAKVGSSINFNFDRTSPKYIRNVFSTNPTKTNSTVTPSNRVVNYWLGESYERSLRAKVTGSTASGQLAFLAPLHYSSSVAATGNWGYRRLKHQPAKTGWIFGRDTGAAADFDAKNLLAKPLFRFCSLHGGDDLQKEIMIAIEDIKLPSNANVNAYPKFSVCVKDLAGNDLEKFTNISLNTADPRFIRNVIGDAYAGTWDESERKYSAALGSIPNASRFIRVEFDGDDPSFIPSDVPWGFAGPERPIGFKLSQGSNCAATLDPANKEGSTTHNRLAKETATSNTFFKGSGSVPRGPGEGDKDLIPGLGTGQVARFTFPSIALRENGTEGGATNPYKVYWGIRPKISTTSTVHDVDYVDYLRALPSHFNTSQHTKTAATGFEHSFIFTLDDIKINTTTNTVTWVSGSRKAESSYTATNGAKALVDKKVRQFVMPLWGGRHGFNIKEKEPLSNTLMKAQFESNSDVEDLTKMSELFSVKKAIGTAHDPEVVPGNLLIAPGFWFKQVTTNLIDTADERQDVLTIIDLENDYTSKYETTDSEATRTGTPATAKSSLDSRNLDSTYACAFYPAVQIMDVLNDNRKLWAPSSLAALGGIAQSEAASAAWFAPAGFNRGGLGALGGSSGPVVTRARQRLDSDDRDLLYDECNVNPIATFPNEGVVIFGQKTLQAASNSALSRINVRRLLIYLKTRINTVAKNILFDQNISSTWARFVGQAEPILADVKARFGLTDYKLVLDETTTTPELIDQNVLYAQVYLKPARAIEYIAIDFIVTRTGASFV